jgi:hypothetical protein
MGSHFNTTNLMERILGKPLVSMGVNTRKKVFIFETPLVVRHGMWWSMMQCSLVGAEKLAKMHCIKLQRKGELDQVSDGATISQF